MYSYFYIDVSYRNYKHGRDNTTTKYELPSTPQSGPFNTYRREIDNTQVNTSHVGTILTDHMWKTNKSHHSEVCSILIDGMWTTH